MYDSSKLYVQGDWNVTKSGHQYHTYQVVVYIPCNDNKIYGSTLAQCFRGFTVVWTRQELNELVLVFVWYVLLLCHKKMYPYV